MIATLLVREHRVRAGGYAGQQLVREVHVVSFDHATHVGEGNARVLRQFVNDGEVMSTLFAINIATATTATTTTTKSHAIPTDDKRNGTLRTNNVSAPMEWARCLATLTAMAAPSHVDVPRPSSSKMTSDRRVACLRSVEAVRAWMCARERASEREDHRKKPTGG